MKRLLLLALLVPMAHAGQITTIEDQPEYVDQSADYLTITKTFISSKDVVNPSTEGLSIGWLHHFESNPDYGFGINIGFTTQSEYTLIQAGDRTVDDWNSIDLRLSKGMNGYTRVYGLVGFNQQKITTHNVYGTDTDTETALNVGLGFQLDVFKTGFFIDGNASKGKTNTTASIGLGYKF